VQRKFLYESLKTPLEWLRCRLRILELGWEETDRLQVAQDAGQWQALVNTVMNTRVHCNSESFLNS
jgi:hypothetical protein